jgi:cytidylate kinase
MELNTDTPPLITVSGPPGSGTSTLSDKLQHEFNFELVNGGDIFRQIATDRGITLAELTELSEEDESIDRELDERLKQILIDHQNGDRTPEGDGLIVESRLAGWHGNSIVDLSVYLTAERECRYNRTTGRAESLAELRRREQSESERYMKYYGADMNYQAIYDICINNTYLSPDGVFQSVAKLVQDRFDSTL